MWLTGSIAIQTALGYCGQRPLVEKSTEAARANPEKDHGKSYVSLVIELRPQNSPPQILKASEVGGPLVSPQIPSQTVFELTRNGKSRTIGFLPEDPMLERGFGMPEAGERTMVAQTAVIRLNIPDLDLKTASSGQIGIRFYHVKPGLEKRVTVDNIEDLAKNGGAALQYCLSPTNFASQLRSFASGKARD